jgi:hypothetical protein
MRIVAHTARPCMHGSIYDGESETMVAEPAAGGGVLPSFLSFFMHAMHGSTAMASVW